MADEKKYTPIQPYDHTIFEDYSMYGKLTYTRDLTLFDSNEVMMNRGNVIHNFQVKMKEPKKIGGDIIDVDVSDEYDVEKTDENTSYTTDFESSEVEDTQNTFSNFTEYYEESGADTPANEGMKGDEL